MAVFLDVKSAYDNVKTDRLIRIGCSLYMLRYIQEWMCDRNIKFVINDEKCDTRLLNKGLPQGGVLSPTLYNIYTAEISTGIDYDIGILQFADDIALYGKDKSLEDCKIKMEVAIHKIDKNLIKLGLEIKPTKTNIMVFNNKKDRENRIVCRLKGKRKKYCEIT